mmetsp:Transcript_23412/g.29103  ORF Transcript_23412/g.29103 Transcript_23412/m.29103 type:complete len:80 (+) Transcript_23412:185-424(+)
MMPNPPQMIKQSSPYPYDQEDDMPYFVRLKEIQETVSVVYAGFPMQANKDFLDNNYERIIKKAATQIEFLFQRLQTNRV